MENNKVKNATYLSRYWFKPQFERVESGVQVHRHGYHIMKAVNFATTQGFRFILKAKQLQYCKDCRRIILWNDQEDEQYQSDQVLTLSPSWALSEKIWATSVSIRRGLPEALQITSISSMSKQDCIS